MKSKKPLISDGSLGDLNLALKMHHHLSESDQWTPLENYTQLKQVAGIPTELKEEPDVFEFQKSAEPRSLGIGSIKLKRGFEGLGNLFNARNEVYFVAWAMDFSGTPIHHYPGGGASAEDVLIPVKAGQIREFAGMGLPLFPPRIVHGGIHFRIQLWESDKDKRDFGETLGKVVDTIKESEVNKLLKGVSLVTGISGATATLAVEAATQLGSLVSKVLKENSDDYVDFFEGTYPSGLEWNTERETLDRLNAVLELQKYAGVTV